MHICMRARDNDGWFCGPRGQRGICGVRRQWRRLVLRCKLKVKFVVNVDKCAGLATARATYNFKLYTQFVWGAMQFYCSDEFNQSERIVSVSRPIRFGIRAQYLSYGSKMSLSKNLISSKWQRKERKPPPSLHRSKTVMQTIQLQ